MAPMSVLVRERTLLGLVPAGGWREFLAEADAEADEGRAKVSPEAPRRPAHE
jgi:hypothetical protein